MGILRMPLRSEQDGAEHNLLQYLLRPSLWATLFFIAVALMLG